MMNNMVDVRHEAMRLGYVVKYISHDIMKNYNACYNMVYNGKNIKTPAVDKLGIPLNEIWISKSGELLPIQIKR